MKMMKQLEKKRNKILKHIQYVDSLMTKYPKQRKNLKRHIVEWSNEVKEMNMQLYELKFTTRPDFY